MSLILGGYSYGSLIATRLPATETILNRFANVINGTAEAEIRLRALHLSRQWNKDVQVRNEVQRTRSLRPLNASTSSSHSIAIAIGGDECEPGSQRSSRESRRSVDAIRTSMERSRRIFKLRKHSGELVEGHLPTEESLGTSEIELPRTYYLLISPLLPPISLFATMFSKFSYTEHEIQASSQSSQARSPTKADGKLVSHQTMAIYGDRDFFTPQKKLRKWAEQLAGRSNSCFQFREVAKAGHFWHEEGAEAQMRGCVRDWLQGI
ncbi:hypothetical protein MMC12_001975 [Toensbergia leucococca]|nr:hypothetical protein [Toensbergia leucococca]